MSNIDEYNRISAENRTIDRDTNLTNTHNTLSQIHTNQSQVNYNTNSNSTTSRKRNFLSSINSNQNQFGASGDFVEATGRTSKKHKVAATTMDCDIDETKEKELGVHGNGKRANFSALGPNTNGSNLKLASNISKPGDIKKLTIKNFKCKL